MKTPFVHVDGDVFIFKDLLNKFINGYYDILTQSVEPINNNVYDYHGLVNNHKNGHFPHYNDSYYKSYQKLKENGFELLPKLDNVYNCGIFGVRTEEIKT